MSSLDVVEDLELVAEAGVTLASRFTEAERPVAPEDAADFALVGFSDDAVADGISLASLLF